MSKEIKNTNTTENTTSKAKITLAEIIANEKIKRLDIISALKNTVEKEKAAGNSEEAKAAQENIKTHNKELSAISTLLNLYSIRNISTSDELFKKITNENKLGQYYSFKIEYAQKFIKIPKDCDFTADFKEMQKALEIVYSVISLINDAKLYETIRSDVLPRYIDNDLKMDFAPIKKTLDNFTKTNSAVFVAGINLCLNAGDVKTFIHTVCKASKSSAINTINTIMFPPFLNEFQGLVSTKINKIELKIAEMKKS